MSATGYTPAPSSLPASRYWLRLLPRPSLPLDYAGWPKSARYGMRSGPAARISSTVESVPSCVEPPAPKVTEKNAGLNCASCLTVARNFSAPSGVFGGKNSKLKLRCPELTRLLQYVATHHLEDGWPLCGQPSGTSKSASTSITICIRLERPLLRYIDIGRLLIRQHGQLCVEFL